MAIEAMKKKEDEATRGSTAGMISVPKPAAGMVAAGAVPTFTNLERTASQQNLKPMTGMPGVFSNVPGDDVGKPGGGLTIVPDTGNITMTPNGQGFVAGPARGMAPVNNAAGTGMTTPVTPAASVRGTRADGTPMSAAELGMWDKVAAAQNNRDNRSASGMDAFEGESIQDVIGDTRLSGVGGLAALRLAAGLSNRSIASGQRSFMRGMKMADLQNEGARTDIYRMNAERETKEAEGRLAMQPAELDLLKAQAENYRADAKATAEGKASDLPAEARFIDYLMTKHGLAPEKAREEAKRAKENPRVWAANHYANLLTAENERLLLDGESRRSPEELKKQAEEEAKFFFGQQQAESTPPPAAGGMTMPGAVRQIYVVPTTQRAQATAQALNPGMAAQPAPTAVKPQPPGKPIDKATAQAILQEAKGDKATARQLAKERGYTL
jgi:hypothetical protein